MQQKQRLPLLQPKQLRLLLFAAAAVIRALLVVYCEWHDRNMKVKFTDIDYKVYTDAAQRVLEGGSPYERHTCFDERSNSNSSSSSSNSSSNSSNSNSKSSSRWSLGWFVFRAYLCLPNLLGAPFFGKVVFCCMDIAVALLIEEGLRRMHRARMQQQRQQQQLAAAGEMQQSAASDRKQALPSTTSNDTSSSGSSSSGSSSSNNKDEDEYPLYTFVLPCCCWLYHPIVATVSVRGNADALPCLLVLLTVSALRRQKLFFAAILTPAAAAAAAAVGSALPRHLRHPNASISAARRSRQSAAALAASSACSSTAAAAIAAAGFIILILSCCCCCCCCACADRVVALPERPGGLLQQLVWGFLRVPVAAALLPVRVCLFLLQRMKARQWLFAPLPLIQCCRGCCCSCFCLPAAHMPSYGFPFLFESYLYHATRRDHRHNFSVFFYLLYLESEAPLKGLSLGLLVPQLIGTLLVGCFFARRHLEAALCLQPRPTAAATATTAAAATTATACESAVEARENHHSKRSSSQGITVSKITMVFVALNKVCTSQYFLWWLCLMPFAVASTDMQPRTLKQTTAALVGFQLANLVWLYFGYQLEFEGKPVYLQLMFSSVLFVATQVGLVGFLSSKIKANDKAALLSATTRPKTE
ncbi:hypothetical protein Emed_003208 [Eimeria media]